MLYSMHWGNVMTKEQLDFQKRIRSILSEIGPETFVYDDREYWMIQQPYEYIEFYAAEQCLVNTSIALPLARGIHNGSHRKSTITRDGNSYKLPYVIHCLLVCRMLIDLHLPLSHEEEDWVLASALCHDMVEDIPFPHHGKELYELYHLDKRVYETVKKVSKRKDFTLEEEQAHFRGIQEDKLALLVKLADRGNNVEDLYNMSVWKIHEYIGETRKYFIPMSHYGIEHYPDVVNAIHILLDKMELLTSVAEIMVDRFEEKRMQLTEQIKHLRVENDALRAEWKALWEGEAK